MVQEISGDYHQKFEDSLQLVVISQYLLQSGLLIRSQIIQEAAQVR
jgi:hypothetical protein